MLIFIWTGSDSQRSEPDNYLLKKESSDNITVYIIMFYPVPRNNILDKSWSSRNLVHHLTEIPKQMYNLIDFLVGLSPDLVHCVYPVGTF